MPFFPVILGGGIEVIGSILLLIGLFSRPAAFIPDFSNAGGASGLRI
jgi:uncharacterized membrane protein YphA (DoxX/SURF4 family)